jgi:hypothetical protein
MVRVDEWEACYDLRLDKIAADSVTDQIAHGMQIELQHDFSAVTLYRSDTNRQHRTNLLVALTVG